jgi:hypothetical protein
MRRKQASHNRADKAQEQDDDPGAECEKEEEDKGARHGGVKVS